VRRQRRDLLKARRERLAQRLRRQRVRRLVELEVRAPAVARELTTTPWSPAFAEASGAVGDSTFRATVTRLYNRMRAALAAADLKAFGIAYDSLGAIVAPSRR